MSLRNVCMKGVVNCFFSLAFTREFDLVTSPHVVMVDMFKFMVLMIIQTACAFLILYSTD